jgi:hypothetical protein
LTLKRSGAAEGVGEGRRPAPVQVDDSGRRGPFSHSGGAFSRGVGAATARWTSRARKALGDARGRAAGSRPHDASRRAPAGADVVVVPPARREGVLRKSTARVSPPATAAASPLLLPDWLSSGLRSATLRCPTSSQAATRSALTPATAHQGKPGVGHLLVRPAYRAEQGRAGPP